jgi:hypothetical protein
MSDDQRMRPRTRTPGPTGSAGDGDTGGTDLAAVRERADRLRRLSSNIIRNEGVGNAERYLAHSRQQGGQ